MYRIHNTGTFIRTANGSQRDRPTVEHHATLETMHPFDRGQFEWMESIGEIVTQSGETVWQITKE